MAITNVSASNQTFRKLMGNGLVYSVPMFQRDYSWTEAEWDDLWQDIVAMLEPGGEQGHYMGPFGVKPAFSLDPIARAKGATMTTRACWR